MLPEVYSEEERKAVEEHIEACFGAFETVLHEVVSPDIHVDVCVIPPAKDRNYYTLVTMGMGAHRMNVPAELAEYKLERAELAIALPADWKVDQEAFRDERWYWPVRLLKTLARLPGECHTWLGWGHTVDNQEPFAQNTELCASMLIAPQHVKEGGEVCALPGGGEVNFYQLLPLYREEMEFKQAYDAEALLDEMAGVSFVVQPDRADAFSAGVSEEEYQALLMDDAAWHLEDLREKHLPVEEITAYNHLAIYLRWCMEHQLMGEVFLERYPDVTARLQADPEHTDLRPFLRDELDGKLLRVYFNDPGEAFSHYYYGSGDAPYFPSDIDDYALHYFGAERYHSDEFQDEAYLFIPFDEAYYQAMAERINQRWEAWQHQGADTADEESEPSALAKAMMEYLEYECQYFPPMLDDDPIIAALSYARRRGLREGFVPMLIAVDETLWECLVMNSGERQDETQDDTFDFDCVTQYRRAILSQPVKNGRMVLERRCGERRSEAEDDAMDWDTEVLGEMAGGGVNDRFLGYWDYETRKTMPLILAHIPVKHPWEVFAYLPFGGWNECLDTDELMAVTKYWFEQYGAVPAVMTHDVLEFDLPAPVPQERAMEVAQEQYAFCPDVVDQGGEDATVGALADTLRQSDKWYFWWD